MGDVTYYFDGYASCEWTLCANSIDGDCGTLCYTSVLAEIIDFNSNTCPVPDLGSIIKVELRGCKDHSYDGGITTLKPAFSGGDGDNHDINLNGSGKIESAWIDITSDTNAPSWTWGDVQGLGCEAKSKTKGSEGYVFLSLLTIRVTYSEVSNASEDLLGEFIIRQGLEDLLGEFEVAHWEDLLGEFIIQNEDEANLLGEFHVGQDSEDLLAEFHVGQGSVDLQAEFLPGHKWTVHVKNGTTEAPIQGAYVYLFIESGSVEPPENADEWTITDASGNAEFFTPGPYRVGVIKCSWTYHDVNQDPTLGWRGIWSAWGAGTFWEGDTYWVPLTIGDPSPPCSGNLQCEFTLNQVNASADFACEFRLTREDLLCEFHVGQDSADLQAEFRVLQQIAQLTTQMTAKSEPPIPKTVTVTSLFTFEGTLQTYADLSAEFQVGFDASRDLLGEAIIRNESSADLLGEFTLRQQVRDLPAEFIVFQAQETAIITTEEFAIAGIDDAKTVTIISDLWKESNPPVPESATITSLFTFEGTLQTYAELSAEFQVGFDASQDLLGEATIHNESFNELPCEFRLRQNFEDLKSLFVVFQSYETTIITTEEHVAAGIDDAKTVTIISDLWKESNPPVPESATITSLFTFEGTLQTYAELSAEFQVGFDASQDLLGEATIRNESSRDLLGEFTLRQNIVDLLCEFVVFQSAEFATITTSEFAFIGDESEDTAVITSRWTLGGTLQTYAGLLAEFRLTREDLHAEFFVGREGAEDLLGKFVLRYGIAELSAEFLLKQSSSSDLPAEFNLIHVGTQEFLGEFIVKQEASQDLLGEFIIFNESSANLLGEFIVLNEFSQDLLGEFIVLNESSQDLLGEFILRKEDFVNLQAEFLAGLPSEELQAEFIIRHSGLNNLLGEFIARNESSTDLLGEFILTPEVSQNLLGKFIVKHEISQDLLAEFIVGHERFQNLLGETLIRNASSTILLGEFEIAHWEDLLGEFEVTHWEDLQAEFIIRQPGILLDLLAEFMVRHETLQNLLCEFIARNESSTDLLGEFIVRSETLQELLGEFIVKHETSQDLLGEALIRNDSSAEFLGEFEVQNESYQNLLGEFHVGQDSADLQAEIIIKHSPSVELLAEFHIRCDYTIQGITKDLGGIRLGECEVALFKMISGTPPTYRFIDSDYSDVDGDYLFENLTMGSYFVRAWKSGSPNVFDTTDNNEPS